LSTSPKVVGVQLLIQKHWFLFKFVYISNESDLDDLLCIFVFSATEIPVVRISGHELTKEYLENSGFSLPILIDKKDGLDIKVPPSNFSVQDVENYVGELTKLFNFQWDDSY